MKIRGYFFSVIFAGILLSCSEDNDIPEIPVFKPDATLSFATSVDGVTASMKSADYDDSDDANIYKLQMILFTGHADDAVFQTDTFIDYKDSPVKSPIIRDKAVQSGAISLLVLTNHTKYTIPERTKLSDFLKEVNTLGEEGGNNGYTMSSAIYKYSVVAGKHNYIAFAPDVAGTHLPANEISKDPVVLVRNVSKVNLVGLTLKTDKLPDGSSPKEFKVDSIFVSNVKSVSRIASVSQNPWGAVETSFSSADDEKWWFGAYADKSFNDIFSTVSGTQSDLLLINVAGNQFDLKDKLHLTARNNVYAPAAKVIGKSFLVYENMKRSSSSDGTGTMKNEIPLGEQTVLIVCGDYTRTLEDGTEVTETNRFYAVPVNNKDYGAGTPSSNVGAHQYVKRNVKYNIALTIVSTGSSDPYGKDAYAHASAQVEVAPWRVVNMGGDAD